MFGATTLSRDAEMIEKEIAEIKELYNKNVKKAVSVMFLLKRRRKIMTQKLVCLFFDFKFNESTKNCS